jgi:hypothetical protein
MLQAVRPRIALDFNGFASTLQGIPLWISLDLYKFASTLQGVPLRIPLDLNAFGLHFASGAPEDFIGFQWICVHCAAECHCLHSAISLHLGPLGDAPRRIWSRSDPHKVKLQGAQSLPSNLTEL